MSSAPDAGPAPPAPAIERLLRRHDAIVLLAIALLCALAWLYTVRGAGLGMSPWEMTRFALFPHRHWAALDAGMAGMAMSQTPWGLLAAMWLAMMVAMMAPSAAPTVLLYARVQRQSPGVAPTGVFALGYLLAWLAFSLLAASVHWLLEHAGAFSSMGMGLHSRWASGSVLLLAGSYQFSPFKQRCLSQCRAPAEFLSRHWRPGVLGALRLGVLHGAYCVGCCGVLMALLFVGGVMNLAWIAALTILVLLEKWLPAGGGVARGVGVLLLAWGIATFFA